MTERQVFDVLLGAWFPFAVVAFIALQFITAPYGRHARRGWGPTVSPAIGWVLMELPAVVVFAFLFAIGARRTSVVAIVFLVMWEGHYVYRAFLYPLLGRGRGRRLPLSIMLMGCSTNIAIDYLNARWLFTFGPVRSASWLADPRFLAGATLFVAGFALHVWADHRLRTLRKPGETGYKIPRGGAYRWVSCPNYLGEIIEWSGWALATWSMPGLAFAVWSAANLVPRARANHRWYRETFPEYPAARRALIPGVL